MYPFLTPFLARVLAVTISAVIAFFVGVSSSVQTGIIVFAVFLLWFFSSVFTDRLPVSVPILRNLKTFQGTVSGIRHSVDTQGTDNGVQTYQVAAFMLDDIPVQLKMAKSIFIEDGDEVVVSGQYRRGMLSGQAYRNRTRRITGHSPVLPYVIFSILFIFIGLGLVASPGSATIGKALLLLGVWFIHRSNNIMSAVREVNTK
jgi:hypothetical protein